MDAGALARRSGFRRLIILWTALLYVLPRARGQVAANASLLDFVFYAGFLAPVSLIVWRTFQHNRPFLLSIGIFLVTWSTIAVIQAMLPFFVTYCLDMENRIAEIMAVVFISALLFLPLWNWFAQRYSKPKAYMLGMGSLILVLFVQAALPSDASLPQVILLAFLAGIGVSTAHIIPVSIIPDTIEWDELQTGKRREGIFYSMATLMRKVASSVTVPWAALILALSGFQESLGLNQSEATFAALRLLVSLAPGLLMILGIILAAGYPLTRERHTRIRRLLKRRKARMS